MHVTDVILSVILLTVNALSTIQEHVGAVTHSLKVKSVQSADMQEKMNARPEGARNRGSNRKGDKPFAAF